MTTPGCPVDESFDPLSPEYLADPYAVLARLPKTGVPVFFAPSIGYYVITRYADIEEVFMDPASYSAAVAQAPLAPLTPEAQQILLAGGHQPRPSMVSLDEPEHARLRKPAARAFSMKRVTAMIPAIEATTARLLDAVADRHRVRPGRRPGLPTARQHRVLPDGRARTGLRPAEGLVRLPRGAQLGTSGTSGPGGDRHLHGRLPRVHTRPGRGQGRNPRRRPDQRPDRHPPRGPGRLDLAEISSILFSLSFAGHETTTGLIGNTVRRLLEDPARWAEIAARPGLIPAAVEESLRYDPSVPVWRRPPGRSPWAASACQGQAVPVAGRRGRDAAAFGEPDRFDLHRPDADRHLAFGKGLHFCLGANLGKLEAQIAIAELPAATRT